MKRLIVLFGKESKYINMPADRIEEREGFIYAYCGSELIGVFDIGSIDMIYVTPYAKEGNDA